MFDFFHGISLVWLQSSMIRGIGTRFQIALFSYPTLDYPTESLKSIVLIVLIALLPIYQAIQRLMAKLLSVTQQR